MEKVIQGKKTDCSVMSIDDRIALVENIFITYPELKEIMDKIEECHQRSKKSSEPKCLTITGEPGCGKTTIAELHRRKYVPKITDEGAVIPVLLVTISAPATVKALATDILDSLGDPLADRGTISTLTKRVYKLTKDCGVEIIIFDEFQHLIDRDSDKVLKVVSDWLKNFLNRTRVPMVLMGMPYSVRILKSNPQLRRRFSAIRELKPFTWDTPGGQKRLLRFLKAIEQALPLNEPSHIYSTGLAFRIFCASGGVISNVMKILRTATIMAIERGMESLTLDLLALAYENEIASLYPGHPNPFSAEDENLKPLPSEESEPPMKQRRRYRRSNKEDNSISKVLSA